MKVWVMKRFNSPDPRVFSTLTKAKEEFIKFCLEDRWIPEDDEDLLEVINTYKEHYFVDEAGSLTMVEVEF